LSLMFPAAPNIATCRRKMIALADYRTGSREFYRTSPTPQRSGPRPPTVLENRMSALPCTTISLFLLANNEAGSNLLGSVKLTPC
jgi:hypothetical protein